LTPQHGAHGTIGSHGGSHGAIMVDFYYHFILVITFFEIVMGYMKFIFS